MSTKLMVSCSSGRVKRETRKLRDPRNLLKEKFSLLKAELPCYLPIPLDARRVFCRDVPPHRVLGLEGGSAVDTLVAADPWIWRWVNS